MNSILSNYLNVYYTDVLDISGIWGGLFISVFPVAAKALDVSHTQHDTHPQLSVDADQGHHNAGKQNRNQRTGRHIRRIGNSFAWES